MQVGTMDSILNNLFFVFHTAEQMRISVDLPDDLVQHLGGPDLSRAALGGSRDPCVPE